MICNTETEIKNLPQKPGVYIFKDSTGEVLYVGKADNIQKRVESYFQESTKLSPIKQVMIQKTKKIEHKVCPSEHEALLFECQLIKKYKPKYNIRFRDDKNYLYIRISYPEDFPTLTLTRKIKKDKAHYYGPFTDSGALKRTLLYIRKLFPYRDCKRNIFFDPKKTLPINRQKTKRKACLHYHLKRCLGPCIGAVTKEEYNKIIQNCELYLQGVKNKLLHQLKQEIKEAVLEKDFERAALLRDRLFELNKISNASLKSDPLLELKDRLGFKKIKRIEGYDISNISGKEAVGSMVVFEDGQPKKSNYRKFKIKSVKKINDVAMIKEVINRRLKHKDWPWPDLIVVDGGKGQLKAVLREIKKATPSLLSLAEAYQKSKIKNIPVVALAKKQEEIYLPDQPEPVCLPKDSKALLLIRRIRDEAHRFALAYHRKLMNKKTSLSILDDVYRIGTKRKKALLVKFGNIKGIKEARFKDLAKILGRKTAKKLKELIFKLEI